MSNSYINNRQIVTAFFNGKFLSKGYINEKVIVNSNLVTLTINPIPNTATIEFNSSGASMTSLDGKSITVRKGTNVEYTVTNQAEIVTNTIVVNNNLSIDVDVSTLENLNWKATIDEENFESGIYLINVINNGPEYVALTTREYKMDDISYISTSTDGIIWSNPIEIDYSLISITYGDNKYVGLDYYNYIYLSTNLTTWNYCCSLGSNSWKCICYGNNKYVALGYNGHISTSTDGTTWETAIQDTNLGSNNWIKLIYANSKFIALGSSGYISTSTDGINWTTAVQDSNLSSYSNWTSIAYDGKKYVVLNNLGYTSLSLDLNNWTIPTQDLTSYSSFSWNDIISDNNKFIAYNTYRKIAYTDSEDTPDLTLTINPVPSDATLTFNTSGIISGNSIIVPYGSYVKYSLEKSGYKSIDNNSARPTSLNTEITVNMVNLGTWEEVGKSTGTTSSIIKNSRCQFTYSSYYNKYIAITDNGYSDGSLITTTDFITYTTKSTGHFGILPSGQIIRIYKNSKYNSTTKKYDYEILVCSLNSDWTFSDSTVIITRTYDSYPSSHLYNGYLIGNNLCFIEQEQVASKSFNNKFIYTSNSTTWNTYTFNSSSDTYSLQFTPLGSNGSYFVGVITQPSGNYKLCKFTSPTSNTVGDLLFSGGNMTSASGFYDGYAFNYKSSSSYININHYTTNGTTKSNYSSTTYPQYANCQQLYLTGTTLGNIYLNINANDASKLGVVNNTFSTLHRENTLPFDGNNILGLINDYIYMKGSDDRIYRNKLINLLS